MNSHIYQGVLRDRVSVTTWNNLLQTGVFRKHCTQNSIIPSSFISPVSCSKDSSVWASRYLSLNKLLPLWQKVPKQPGVGFLFVSLRFPPVYVLNWCSVKCRLKSSLTAVWLQLLLIYWLLIFTHTPSLITHRLSRHHSPVMWWMRHSILVSWECSNFFRCGTNVCLGSKMNILQVKDRRSRSLWPHVCLILIIASSQDVSGELLSFLQYFYSNLTVFNFLLEEPWGFSAAVSTTLCSRWYYH